MPENEISRAFRISQLLALKQQAELSERELLKLELWLNESELNRQLYARINDTAIREQDISMMNTFDTVAARKEAWAKLGLSKIKPKSYLLYRIMAVAATVAAIVFGVWFYTGSLIKNDNSEILSKTDIAPGSNKAILTLANGKRIALSNAKTGIVINLGSLKYNDGSLVEKTSVEGTELLTASTPRGGTYKVTLADGTRVWLNADSKISFPAVFTGDQRKISLSGEAYFEVFKDKKHPFVVESKGQKVEVLGTHFNVNAYDEETMIKTTLLEGSVRVTNLDVNRKSDMVILQPNQQSVLADNNSIVVKQINVDEAVAWKNGYFRFRDENIAVIMRQLARWYDVAVVYEGEVPKALLNGKITSNRNISQVLKMLEKTKEVQFKIEGRRVVVTK